MAKNKQDNAQDWNALGRFFHWLNGLGESGRLTWVLGAACLIVLVLNLTFSNKGHFAGESYIGFYALFGFVAFAFIIFAAKILRVLIKQDEGFYGDKAIDSENYPQAGTERVDHHVD